MYPRWIRPSAEWREPNLTGSPPVVRSCATAYRPGSTAHPSGPFSALVRRPQTEDLERCPVRGAGTAVDGLLDKAELKVSVQFCRSIRRWMMRPFLAGSGAGWTS